MNLPEKANALIASGEVQDASENFLADVASAISGDAVSIGKVLIALAKSPFFVREQLFWTKLEVFINGVYLSEEDKASLRAKLWRDGKKKIIRIG